MSFLKGQGKHRKILTFQRHSVYKYQAVKLMGYIYNVPDKCKTPLGVKECTAHFLYPCIAELDLILPSG